MRFMRKVMHANGNELARCRNQRSPSLTSRKEAADG